MKKLFTLLILAAGVSGAAQAQNVGIGEPAPQQKLDVSGAIRIGTTAAGVAGSIRYNAGVFEGYNGSAWVPFGSGNGTVTSIATGTGLTGGPITGSGTISLANTAVTPGVYGNATSVGTFTVDAQGRITSASNTAITGVPPGGAAGGDLTGTYPNPDIAANAVTTAEISDLTITNADIANGTINLTQKVSGVLPIANGGTNTNAIGPAGTVAYSNGTAYAFTGVGTAGQVLRSNGLGAPTWVDPNAALTKRDVTTSGNGITVGNGTGQVVGAANLTVDVATNSLSSPGVVPAPTAGNANRAWGTDAAGNPSWSQINTNQILDGTIATADIANNAVDGTKINITGNSTGDLMYYNGTDWVRLPAGTAGQVLQTNGAAAPSWRGAPGGSGTTNYLARWTPDGSTLGIGVSYDNGTNVGIGTTAPTQRLDVNGEINAASGYRFGTVPVIYNSPTDVYANVRVLQSNSTINDGMYVNYNSTGGAAAHLRFFANGTTERARIDAGTGHMGIGTTAPADRLHVNGGRLRITGPDWSGIYLENTAGGGNLITLENNAGGAAALRVWNQSAVGSLVEVKYNGRVGIGTTNPGFRLNVLNNVDADWTAVFQNNTANGAIAYFAHGDGYGAYIDAGGDASDGTYALNVNRLGNSFLYVRGNGNIQMNRSVFFDCNDCGSTGTWNTNIGGGGGWGDLAIQGRVLSANSNIHLSPPGGSRVIVNSVYRGAGGGTGTTGIDIEDGGIRFQKRYRFFQRYLYCNCYGAGTALYDVGAWDYCSVGHSAFKNNQSATDEDDDVQCAVYANGYVNYGEQTNWDSWPVIGYNARPNWYMYLEALADSNGLTCMANCINFD